MPPTPVAPPPARVVTVIAASRSAELRSTRDTARQLSIVFANKNIEKPPCRGADTFCCAARELDCFGRETPRADLAAPRKCSNEMLVDDVTVIKAVARAFELLNETGLT